MYDAWGACEVHNSDGSELADQTHIGNLNPYRYRGYYYDVETGLYFLKTRYYDPETGRFITIDDLSYLDPETINGLNLYAYCGNNPVMNVDPEGTMPKWLSKLLGWVTVVALAVVAVAMIAVVAVGTVASGGLLAAVLVGAGVGILAGLGGSIIAQGGIFNIKNIDPWSVAVSGAIGGVIGAASGATSFAFSKIGGVVGQHLGFILSNARHIGTGIKIAKVFGLTTTMLMKAGAIAGGMLGGSMAGMITNNLINDIVEDVFGKEYEVDNPNYMRSILLQFFKWLNPIR